MILSESAADFAVRILEDAGTNAWYVALGPAETESILVKAIIEEANTIQEGSAAEAAVTTPANLISVLRRASARLVVAAGLNGFNGAAWSTLDSSRSRLMREGITTMVLSPAAFGSLQTNAPNLASWIGGAVFEIAAPVPHGSAERLTQLRAWAGLSDADVIGKGEEGTLPADPYFAEWLVLLGRGDLLG